MLGDAILDARKRLGISQHEACRGLCDRSMLSHIERNQSLPSLQLLGSLCDRLHLPVAHALEVLNRKNEDGTVFLSYLKDLYSTDEFAKVVELGTGGLKLTFAKDNTLFRPQILNEIGRAHHRLGQYEQALESFTEAFHQAQYMNFHGLRTYAEHGLATTLQDLDVFDGSLRHYESCYSATGNYSSITSLEEARLSIICRYNYARLLALHNFPEKSKQIAREAALSCRRFDIFPVGGHLEYLLGILSEETGDVTHAREHLGRAHHLYQFYGDTVGKSAVRNRLNRL